MDLLKMKFMALLMAGGSGLSELMREFPIEKFDEIGCLAMAASKENQEVVERLLDAGCQIDASNTGTALEAAVNVGNPELVELLLKRGADPNLPNQRLLFCAIRNVKGNGLKIAKILVEHGIDVNLTFDTFEEGAKKTALDWSVQNPEIEAFLKSIGARTAEELGHVSPSSTEVVKDPLVAFMSSQFGPVETSGIVELVEKSPRIDILIIRPNEKSNSLTLFTSGMSLAPMSGTERDHEYAFAELFIQLPSSWPTDARSLGNINYRWPIEWLRNIARYPHRHGSSLKGPFTIVTNSDSANSLSPDNEFTAMLVKAEHEVQRKSETIHLYRLTPLYKEEVELHRTEGMNGLAQAFDRHGVSRVVDINRVNVAKHV